VLALVCVAEFLAMSVWFSFSAIKPALAASWSLSNSQAGLILAAFQFGYIASVVGVGYLADLFNVRRVFAVSALIAALGNLGFALLAGDLWSAVALRLLVGAAMAGVYTPGIKFLALWFPGQERGRAVGVFVGALVAGSASPYLLVPVAEAFGWRTLVAVTVVAAALAAAIMVFLIPDPPQMPQAATRRFNFGLLRSKPLALMNGAYVAHMWELYAMWGWIGPFLVYALLLQGHDESAARALGGQLAFLFIAVGAIACALAGVLSDRFGRTITAGAFLIVSCLCSFVFGFLALAPLFIILLIGLVYGFAIVGDSPVFSAGITELAPPENAGAALGVQSVLGFGATVISVALFGTVADAAGYAAAFAMLGIGAALGPLALFWLRRLPDATLMAGGRR
jgi:MFS family permease